MLVSLTLGIFSAAWLSMNMTTPFFACLAHSSVLCRTNSRGSREASVRLPGLRGRGLLVDGLAQPSARQDSSTTLNTVQRMVLIRILSALKTVSTATLEVEAHILPTHPPPPPRSIERHRRPPHSTARPPHLGCTAASPETEEKCRPVHSFPTGGSL